MKTKRIVITGGPATGKTAIVDKLKVLGYSCYEEVIRKLTAEAQESGDIVEQHSNPIALVTDALEFNQKLINLRLDDYKEANEKLNFYDRGMPDVLAYMSYFDQEIPSHFEEVCKNHIYDTVFILPPWKKIFGTDSERFENFKQAKAIFSSLKKTYELFGYQCIEVPKASIEKRTRFILTSIDASCNNQ